MEDLKYQVCKKPAGTVMAAFKLQEDAEKYASLHEGYFVRLAARNPNNAGRTPKFSDREKDEIRAMRKSGMNMREIAKKAGRSLGLVQKLINEQ